MRRGVCTDLSGGLFVKRHHLIAITILFLIGTPIYFAIQEAREAASASSCLGNMCHIQKALLLYEAHNGHYPPAFIPGPDGTPWHS